MNRKRLQYLLKCVRNNSCNEEEQAELNAWFHSLNYGYQDFESWLKENGGREKLADILFHDFTTNLKRQNKVISFNRSYIAVAAAIILLVVSFGLLFYRNVLPVGEATAKRSLKMKIEPGSNKAYLTLADGSKIVLNNARKGELANQDGINVSKTADGQLLYTVSSNIHAPINTSTYNVLATPRGGQYQVILPDGTKVHLNAASSLRYPVRFNTKERKVELVGEAYFEVAHNKVIPFKVFTGKQELMVLGTHFNVKAYPDESSISTTLVQGSVKISNLSSGQSELLKPGQQSDLFTNQNRIDISQANLDKALAWKSGYFVFDNQDIKSIMKVISRWYDVDVEYKSININERFGGTFSRSENLSEMLMNLELLGKIHFKIEERRIIITD